MTIKRGQGKKGYRPAKTDEKILQDQAIDNGGAGYSNLPVKN